LRSRQDTAENQDAEKQDEKQCDEWMLGEDGEETRLQPFMVVGPAATGLAAARHWGTKVGMLASPGPVATLETDSVPSHLHQRVSGIAIRQAFSGNKS
jgi:hypothetical protein